MCQSFLLELQRVHGCCLTQTAGGYFVNVSLVPRDLQAHSHPTFSATIAPIKAAKPINMIHSAFVTALRGLGSREIPRDSVQKNSLANPSKFNILTRDQRFLLGLMDGAVQAVDADPNVRFLLSLSLFGQKSRDSLDFGAWVDVDHIICASVHLACTIRPVTDSGLHVMWSRSGLEEWVGDRGCSNQHSACQSVQTSRATSTAGRWMCVGSFLMFCFLGRRPMEPCSSCRFTWTPPTCT